MDTVIIGVALTGLLSLANGAAPTADGIAPGSVVTPSIQHDALAPIEDAPPAQPTAQPSSRAPSSAKGTAAISQMIAEGEACFSRKQYACSITNATNVLQQQPGNAAAARLKARAEAAQADALNNIKIE